MLLSDLEAQRYAGFCAARGFKKSTLAARLIREHLDREGFQENGNEKGRKSGRTGSKELGQGEQNFAGQGN